MSRHEASRGVGEVGEHQAVSVAHTDQCLGNQEKAAQGLRPKK